MIPEFSQLVRQRREQLGLRVVDVVRLIGGYKTCNEAKPIRVLEQLERDGRCHVTFFYKVMAVLKLDEAILAASARAHEEAYEKELDAVIPPTIHWMEASNVQMQYRRHGREPLPLYTPRGIALDRACRYAMRHNVLVQLVLSRRQAVRIDAEGNVRRIECLDRRRETGVRVVLNGRTFFFDRGGQ